MMTKIANNVSAEGQIRTTNVVVVCQPTKSEPIGGSFSWDRGLL